MRVEPVHHSVDGFLDELVVGDGLDVIRLDLAEDRGQELQVLVRNRHPGVALRDRREVERKQDAQHRAQPDQSCLLPVSHRSILIACDSSGSRPLDPRFPDPTVYARLAVGEGSQSPLQTAGAMQPCSLPALRDVSVVVMAVGNQCLAAIPMPGVGIGQTGGDFRRLGFGPASPLRTAAAFHLHA